jgi:hypothetical protein
LESIRGIYEWNFTPLVSILLITSYFVPIVPYWFVKIYAKEFAIREHHLMLEVITLIVRNIVEGVRYTFIIKGCFVLATYAAKANTN